MVLRDWLAKWRSGLRGKLTGRVRCRKTILRDVPEGLEVRVLLTELLLSNSSVPENSAVNTYVGTLTTSDAAPGETLTYTLVSGVGSNYNNYFQVNGDSLRTRLSGASYNFESSLNSLSIRVRSVGSVSGTVENTFTINVTDVDEPVTLNNSGSPELASVDNQDFINPGNLITTLIASMSPGGISDPEMLINGTGIAVIGADSSHGTWDFTTDGGATWFPLGTVSETNAGLLASDMNTRIRFIPDGFFEGRIDPAITFRAWDRTIGANGTHLDLTPYLGGLHLSSATETASLHVRSEREVLLKDVNQTPITLSPSISSGGFLYYTAIGEGTGRELWRTDGTPEGTKLVRDIALGEMGSDPSSFIDVNGILYFSAINGVNGRELWKTDGTPEGTMMVADINPGSGDSSPRNFHLVAGRLYFTAIPGSQYGGRVFELDPTTDETVWLDITFSAGSQPRLSEIIGSVGSIILCSGDTGITGYELYKFDTVTSQIGLVMDIAPGSSSSLPRGGITSNGYLLFSANDGTHGLELWRTDGTTSGTVLLKDITAGSGSGINSLLFGSREYASVVHDGWLYFAANRETTSGRQLWRTDGTESGTTMVVDVSSSGNIKSLTSAGGMLYFTLSNNSELWVSDGTAAGTQKLKKFTSTAAANFEPSFLTEFDGSLYFSENDNVSGAELWRTDGTVDGTVQVFDQIPGFVGSTPSELAVFDDHLIYFASDDLSRRQLWRTDGTVGGTVQLFEYATWSDSVNSPVLTLSMESGGLLYFRGLDVEYGNELWVTDGTPAGTRMVMDINPGASSSAPYFLATVNGLLYFSAQYNGASGQELWVTDGTPAGTRLVKEINTGGHGVSVSNTERKGIDLNGTFLFLGINVAQGTELWKSDGTAAGTLLVKDINPGGSSNIRNFTVVAGIAYFIANDGVHGEELWRSDGTTEGTYLVSDIRPGSQSSSATQLIAFGNDLYFQADDGIHGKELWKSDGTQNGTVLLADIAPGSVSSTPDRLTVTNGLLYFSATDPAYGIELWRTDGTSVGTNLIKDIVPGTQGSSVSNLVAGQGILFFTASTPQTGGELWKTDGTLAGTVLVKDIRPGSTGSGGGYGFNQPLVSNDGYLYFGAGTNDFGNEIWRSDGTTEGTSLLADLYRGPRDSKTGQFYFINGSLVFLGNDGIHGYEYWAIPNRAPTLSDAGDPHLTTVLEDDMTNSGTSIADVISSMTPDGGLSDPDTHNFLGIAITGTDPTAGTWEFSTDSGITWESMGPVSPTQARLLWGNESTKIRLIPNPNWNGQVDQVITFRGWDRTLGSNGDLADTTQNGGKTSFSIATETVGISVIAVNDPPSEIFLSSNEVYEYLPAGTIIGAFSSIDVDSTDPFSYQLVPGDGSFGNPWFRIEGNVLKTAAVLSYSEFQSYSIRVRSTDLQGAFAERKLTINVLNINDAPVLNPNGNPILDTITLNILDSSNPGTGISDLIARIAPNGGITDVDPGALRGIAINGLGGAATGAWQFTIDGGSHWEPIDSTGNNNARLLAANPNTRIRYRPNSDFVGEVKLSFVAWDQTSGTNGGTANVNFRGGTSAFSLNYDYASQFVVNSAPVLNPEGNPTLTDIPQGTPASENPGTLVSDIIARMAPNGGITDINPGALKGIAVNALSGTGTGIWQFTTDGGTNWLNFGSTGNSTARLLAADGLTRVRYSANTSFLGEVKFAFVAWDQTTGTNGGTANVSSRGGTTAFSLAYEYASQFMVNTAPELNPNGNPTLNSIPGGVSDANNSGTLITEIISRMAPNGVITDPNPGAVKGIAINGLGGTSTGVWEYTINNGSTWASIGTTGNFDARLLAADANTRIRLRPNLGFVGEVKLAFVAWDQTSGVNGGTANVNTRGGATAFSVNYEYASLFVVNNAPVLNQTNASYITSIPMNVSNGANTGTLVSDLIARIGPNGITDTNPAALQGIAINGLGGTSNGTWQYTTNGGVSWSSVGTTGNSNAQLLAADANTRIRFVPNQNFTGNVKLAFVAWDQTSGVNGGVANVSTRGGSTAFSTLYDYASLSVV